MSWTTPADIRAQARRLWESGRLPAALVTGEELFPRRLVLKKPGSGELAEQFARVRGWIDTLRKGEADGYRIRWREFNHRVLGVNSLPDEIWIDSTDDALRLIGQRTAAARLRELADQARTRRPELLAWLARRPLRALELAPDWPRLLDIVDWLAAHPRPAIYMRQLDLPGVHTKFIEAHRGALAEMLELVLPAEAVDCEASGIGGFCRRYGFRDRPLRVRFRLLDPALAVFPGGGEQDITVNQDVFAALRLSVRRVFITENEINYLALPPVSAGMVIFGGGYGFEMLSGADWLHDCAVHYWGDIDTHGFAILDQLRARLPHAHSFLMDRETLLEHRALWGEESRPEKRDLHRLTQPETALYDDLREDHLAPRLRLEQEKISFDWVRQTLSGLGLIG